MKKMNKILAMMIALGMAVSLMASCGEDNKQTSGQEGADTSATEQLTDDTLGEMPAQNTASLLYNYMPHPNN